jgi:hypothetical protein
MRAYWQRALNESKEQNASELSALRREHDTVLHKPTPAEPERAPEPELDASAPATASAPAALGPVGNGAEVFKKCPACGMIEKFDGDH